MICSWRWNVLHVYDKCQQTDSWYPEMHFLGKTHHGVLVFSSALSYRHILRGSREPEHDLWFSHSADYIWGKKVFSSMMEFYLFYFSSMEVIGQ